MREEIVIVSNHQESPWIDSTGEALQQLGDVHIVSEEEMISQIETSCYDLVIVDASAINRPIAKYVAHLHNQQPSTPILVVTMSPTWRRARELFLAGAADYVHRSFDPEKMLGICQNLLRHVPSVILM